MPEGPEAHTMADELKVLLIDKYITRVNVLDADHARDIESSLLPDRIINVYAVGKRPVIETTAGYFMTFLCMTGRWLATPANHTRVEIEFCDYYQVVDGYIIPRNVSKIYFDDQRSMGKGYVEWIGNFFKFYHHILSHGPDLLTTTMEPRIFVENTFSKFPLTITLDLLILSTEFTSSIGNYLKSEILYHTGLSPLRTLGSCSYTEIERLYIVARNIVKHSYNMKGYTRRDYLRPDGRHGQFVYEIYGGDRQFDRMGNSIVKYKSKDGRSTYWVPNVQH